MRFQTCFIVWHGKEPVFSIDFHPSGKIATGGADNTIKVQLILKILYIFHINIIVDMAL
jgi:WD40 repeat protein